MIEIPSLELFRNMTSGDYRLLNYAINPRNRFRVGWSDLIKITASEMDTKGLEIILSNLAGFGERDGSEKCELDRMPSAERRRFCSKHKSISISQPSQQTLAFQGSTKTPGGGRVGTPDRRLEIRLPTNQETLSATLLRVFDMTE